MISVTEWNTNDLIWINPRYIVTLYNAAPPTVGSMIKLEDGRKLYVKEPPVEVVERIKACHD